MSAYDDDAYEPGDPKRSDYREPQVCSICLGVAGHYPECVEVTC